MIDQVVGILRKRGIPYKKIHVPYVVLWEGREIGIATIEEHKSEPHMFHDIVAWEQSLDGWDMSEIMHIYTADECYEPRATFFDTPLDALAAWIWID